MEKETSAPIKENHDRKKSGVLIGLAVFLLIGLLAGGAAFGIRQYQEILEENDFLQKEQVLCVGQDVKPVMGLQDTEGLVWSVSDEDVAEVSLRGVVRGKAEGETTLTANEGIFRYECTVNVREHDPSEMTCVDDSVCRFCGQVLQKAPGHDFTEADCTHGQKCRKCGVNGEPALGHDFSEPTCEERSKCTRCGIDGQRGPLGHSFREATCTQPSVCTRCGAEEGKPLGHQEGTAKCMEPVVCTVCGEIVKEAAEHTYKSATCTKPETCSKCGATRGEALGHDADPATCTAASVCKRCKTTVQAKLPHTYVDTTIDGAPASVCAYCGEKKPAPAPTPAPSAPAPSSPSSSTGASASAGGSTGSAYLDRVIELVNEERANNGLAALSMDSTLMSVAQIRSGECASAFSHSRPDGSSCFTAFDQCGVSYRTAGENIAAGQSSPEEVVQSWMNSEGHRANILNPAFTRIGVGYTQSSDDFGHYWAQDFAG